LIFKTVLVTRKHRVIFYCIISFKPKLKSLIMNNVTRCHSHAALRGGWFKFLVVLTIGGLLIGSCRKLLIRRIQNTQAFEKVVLVANQAKYGPKLVDSTLRNGWGLAWSPTGIAWVNSNVGHVSELYTGEGAIVRPPINSPSPNDSVGGAPTGIVFSGGAGFTLADQQGASFLFVGADGVLSGWNGADGNNAQLIRDRSAHSAYTGLALDSAEGTKFIYAANFRTKRIDVWDNAFNLIPLPFHDRNIPSNYAPFNIQPIGKQLYVTYAEIGSGGREADGIGKGFVDVFRRDGSFVRRFASQGTLNAPWGIAWAPAGRITAADISDGRKKEINDDGGGGDHSGRGGHDGGNGGNGGNNGGDGNNNNGGDGNNNGNGDNNGNNDGGMGSSDSAAIRPLGPVVLIGNLGDGKINVFSAQGSFLGQLVSHNRIVVIDGLWALGFPPATATSIDSNRLYFTAGPAGGADGMFGYLIRK